MDTTDPYVIAVVLGALILLGSRMAAPFPKLRSWGLRLAVAVFLVHLGYVHFAHGLDTQDLPRTLVRSVNVAGFVLAPLWLILPVVFFTCIDVVGRKIAWHNQEGVLQFSLQIWLQNHLGRMFESTILQEMEWHFHAALFALVLGYGVVYNTHVRIDLIRENLHFRKKAWLELAGLSAFMIPYCAVVIWFAIEYVQASYAVGEGSASTVGLTHRWLIKSVLVIGLVTALGSGVAVALVMKDGQIVRNELVGGTDLVGERAWLAEPLPVVLP